MRKSPIVALGLAAAVGVGVGGVAAAQEDTTPGHTLQVSVSPSKAGKKKKPRSVGVKLSIQNNRASKTTAGRIVVNFPETIKIDGKGFKTCSAATLDPSTGKGPGGCPKGSKLGTGTASAVLGPYSAQPKELNFKNTFFVGGSKLLNIYLEEVGGSENAIKTVLQAKVGNAGGKYGQKLTIDIPESLQQPVPGLFSALAAIKTSLKGTTGKGKKKHGIFESTGCVGGQFDFQTQIFYSPNPNQPAQPKSDAEDTVACKK